MNTTPKLPFFMRASLWISITGGFVALALATISMFVMVSAPIFALSSNNRRIALTLDSGRLGILNYDVSNNEPLKGWLSRNMFFVGNRAQYFSWQELYRFQILDSDSNNHKGVYFPLVTISFIFLLAFFLIARKASKMRRKAIFSVPTEDQERS